jgi:hypothetical protein
VFIDINLNLINVDVYVYVCVSFIIVNIDVIIRYRVCRVLVWILFIMGVRLGFIIMFMINFIVNRYRTCFVIV